MSEWDFEQAIHEGSSGRRARLVQEWLCLHDLRVVVDGQYGPATAAAVRQFQNRHQLSSTGNVNQATFQALVEPLIKAREPVPATGGIGRMVVAYAKRHLAQRPREVGGQNMGPWVRLYMKGNEGSPWPWCAGFVSFVVRQAVDTVAAPMPFRPTFSCDLLAADARQRGSLVSDRQLDSASDIPVGSVFLNRRVGGDWTHTGIVIGVAADTFETIEGNTNDAGDREGYEVCRRVRGLKDKDFVVYA